MLPQTAAAPASSKPFSDDFQLQSWALLLLILIAYANAISSSFHFDDSAIFANPWIVSPGFGWDIFRLEQTRPLTYLTFHWNYLIGGQNPMLYHWVNVLLHAGNCILLLGIARRYLPPFAAACVAVVFALHPLQTESVTYVFARATLLSTHFALWTLWLYARGKYLGSALLFGVSLLAKEETIALPGFLLLLDLFERRRPKFGYFAMLAAFAALAAGRLFYLIHIWQTAPSVGRVRGVTPFAYLITQSRVLWIYLRLAIAPFGLNLDHDVRFSTSLISPWTTLAAALTLTALIACLAWLAWKKSPAALWALGFFVLISPSSSIVPQSDAMYEHRTYLPLACLTIALGFLLERVPHTRLAIAFAVLLPAMLAGTVLRNQDWRDEQTFLADIAAKSPNKGRSWLGMATLYPSDPAKQRTYLEKGIAVDPDNPELHANYGVVLMKQQQPAAALVQVRRAMALSEETAMGWSSIGVAEFQMLDTAAAVSAFERALRLDPCNYDARINSMMLHAARQEPHEVWLAGDLPATCRLLPHRAATLQAVRRQAGKP